jgi:hypothetical protein
MSRKPPSLTPDATPSHLLLRAALAGLLSASVSACSTSSTPDAHRETTPEEAHITSTESVGALTADDFQAMCDERGGTVEVLAHCGGLATAAGFAYDSGDGTISEHTCAGANTCGGWNCITDSQG